MLRLLILTIAAVWGVALFVGLLALVGSRYSKRIRLLVSGD